MELGSRRSLAELRKTVRTIVNRNGSCEAKTSHVASQTISSVGKTNLEGLSKVEVVGPAAPVVGKKTPLPPRLRTLETFYEGLEAAISLLAIRRQMATFKSVCKTVEQMSKRRFLRSHLAQMKFLFPEVIDLDYVRAPDTDSRRDIWDLRITLRNFPANPGASPVKGSASPSRYRSAQTLRRKKEFHSRLVDFARSQDDENVDVPQEALPQRPLGGQPVTSPTVAECAPGAKLKSAGSAVISGRAERSRSENLSTAGDEPFTVRSNKNLPGSVANTGDEVYEFCIVKAGPMAGVLPDSASHFPQTFSPHFGMRAQELNSVCNPDEDSLDVERTSHFASFFKPRFQERHMENEAEARDRNRGGPSEKHLQPSAQARVVISLPSALRSEIEWEEGTRDIGVELQARRASDAGVNFVSKERDSDPTGVEREGEETAAVSLWQTPVKDSQEESSLSFTPLKDVFSPASAKQGSGHRLVRSGADLFSFERSPNSSANTPCRDDSPAASATSCSQTTYSHLQNTPVPELIKASGTPHVESRSHSTIRSLKFGSPTKPPRPPPRRLEETVSLSPPVEIHLKSTPRGDNTSSTSSASPSVIAPETPVDRSTYSSPVKPNTSRALLFNTPVKPTQSDQSEVKPESNFQSPQVPRSPAKPPRFLSPTKTQPPITPATPIPTTPTRTVIYSPTKRTRFTRGSLFSNQDEDEGPSRRTLNVENEVAERRAENPSDLDDLDAIRDVPISECSTPTTRSSASLYGKVSEEDLKIIHSLPADLVQSVREKERKLKDESTKELMLQKRRQQMMSGLPKMFNQLRMMFQSVKRSVLPRNELLKNVLSSNSDITDREEVEERLKLLIEIVPEWITKHPSSNGDYIYRINKSAKISGIQKKILNAC